MSKVYARVDGNGYITGIDGGYTMGNLRDLTGWVLIDEGGGGQIQPVPEPLSPRPHDHRQRRVPV